MNCMTLFSRKNPHRLCKDRSCCWQCLMVIFLFFSIFLFLLILFIIPTTVNASYNYVRYHDTHDMMSGCPLNSSIVCDNISKCKMDNPITWKCNRLMCHYDNPELCIEGSFGAALFIIGIPVLILCIALLCFISFTGCQRMCGEVNLAMKYDEENPKQI